MRLTQKTYAVLLYDEWRNYESAIEGLEAALDEDPSNDGAMNNLAMAFWKPVEWIAHGRHSTSPVALAGEGVAR